MRAETPMVLLLENDTADVFMFRRVLGRLGYKGNVRVVTTVAEAISYLEHRGYFHDPNYSPRPDLIVCDLKLCASTGTELLQWVRAQEDFRSIPVVMLSGSSTPRDRERAAELGACGFYLKSGEISEMTARIADMLVRHLPNAFNGEVDGAPQPRQQMDELKMRRTRPSTLSGSEAEP